MSTAQLNHLWGQLWIDECIAHGVRHFCVSPGSRSTPLTTAIARTPHAECHMFTDERAAAYFALGVGRATGVPAALICTSGTAVANYLPAVIEASMDHIPMLICSADRPPELQYTHANQTIQQLGVLGSYTRWSAALPCPTSDIPEHYVRTTAGQAYTRALYPEAGPVHINFAFRKPLEPSVEELPPLRSVSRPPVPYTQLSLGQSLISKTDIHAICSMLRDTQRGWIILGRQSPQAGSDFAQECRWIRMLCNRLKWPIYADSGSGLFNDPELTSCIRYTDWVVRNPQVESKPECIIHLGGPFVSKHMDAYIRKHTRTQTRYIVAWDASDRLDPHHSVTHRIHIRPSVLCEQLLREDWQPHPEATAWSTLWLKEDQRIRAALNMHVQTTTELYEPWIARSLLQHIPTTHALFVGNSMPIRYIDGWSGDACRQRLHIGMNRGASGIEGLLATALGYTTALRQPGVLYIGDISMLHDLSSLLLLQKTKFPLVVVVLNNSGGGIFRRLPIAQHTDVFVEHFITPHTTSFTDLAYAMGIEAHTVSSRAAWEEHIRNACSSTHSILLELRTESQMDLSWTQHIARTLDTESREKAHE